MCINTNSWSQVTTFHTHIHTYTHTHIHTHTTSTWRNAQLGENIITKLEEKSQEMATEMKDAIGKGSHSLPSPHEVGVSLL